MKTHSHVFCSRARNLIAAILPLVAISTGAATYQSVIQSDGPLAYYRFNESAPPDLATNQGSIGVSGNGTHGPKVIHRTPGAIVGDPDASAGYSSAGGARHTFVPYNPALNPTADKPFTIEYWAAPSVEVSDAPGPCPLFNRVSAGNRSGWVFFQRSVTSGWNFRMYNGAGSSLGIDLTGGSNAQNTWSHIVAVWTGSLASLYVNGVLVAGPTAPSGGYNASTSAIFSIGSYDDGVQNPFDGSVDEVAFYTNALSAAQILAHYLNGINAARTTPYSALVTSDGAVEYLRLNEASPTVDTAINLGALGAAADGLHFPGAGHQVAGAIAGDSNTAIQYSAIDTNSDDGGVPTIVPFNADLNPSGSFSVEAWLKPTAATLSNQQCPLYNRITANTPFVNREGWDFFQQPAGWRFRMFNGNGGNTVFGNLVGGPLIVNGWQHLVAVYDAAVPSCSLYINGTLAASSSTPNGTFTANTSAPFAIGGFPLYSNGHYENPFIGSIDEVAIYTNTLSAARVLAHYQNGTNSARSTAYSTLVLSDKPAGYWRLDEPAKNVADNFGTLGAAANGTYTSVTNPNNNTVQIGVFSQPNVVPGPQSPTYVGFETNNQAAYFDGLTNYVDLLNPAGLNFSGPVSIEAWILPDASQNFDADIAAHGVNDDLTLEDALRIEGTDYQILSYNGANHLTTYTVPGDLGAGIWVHLVGTYDGANWNLYRNGVLVSTTPDAVGLLSVSNANWAIGARGRWKYATALDREFAGAADEVAIYNYALSQSRIQAHYSMGVYGQSPLTIQKSGIDIILTWPAGTLQQAANVTGPYTDVAGNSPLTVPAPGNRSFYRIRFQ